MYNNNKGKISEELSRMLELSEGNTKKSDLIKESFKSKLLKENEEDFFDFLDSDESDEKTEKEFEGLNPSTDIPTFLKLALVTNSINQFQAKLFDLESKNFLQINDLYSNRINQNDEKGAVVSKSKSALYPGMSIKEFKESLINGRLTLKIGNTEEDIDNETTDKVFKWLSSKNLSNISLGENAKVNQKGNATLNFLARILSNKPKDEIESKIIETFGDGAKYNAMKILLDYFKVASKNTLLPLLNMKPTPENINSIEDGVVEALTNLAGARGSKLELKETNWNPSQNIGPWVFQVAKNSAKNDLKEKTSYVPNLETSEEFLSNMLDKEGVITIISRKEPKGDNKADKVSKIGDKYKYIYNDLDSALYDLENADHFKSMYLELSKYGNLFKSVRKAPISMSPEMEKETGEKISYEDENLAKLTGIDNSSEQEIRKILGKVVDFMTLDSKKYGIKKATHDPSYISTNDEKEIKNGKNKELIIKRKELAKENAINFMYNFLISAIGETGDSKNKTTDIGNSGKFNPEVINQWIDSQRKKMLTQLVKIEKKNNPNISSEEIKLRAEELGLLTRGGKFNQSFKTGLHDYFKENKEDFKIVLNDIKNTSPEGYELNVDTETIFESKIRAKIQKILKESFEINEIEKDFIDSVNDIDTQLRTFGAKFENLLKGDYDSEMLINDMLDVISGREINYNFQNSEYGQHNFITSTLASVYSILNKNQKNNVLKYIFTSFFPNKEESKIVRMLSQKVSNDYYAATDLVWDAIISVESNGNLLLVSALENYDPTKGKFSNFLFNRILQKALNIRTSEKSYTEKGERKYINKDSIDTKDDDNNSLSDKLTDYDSNKVDINGIRNKIESLIFKAESKNILSKSELNLLKSILEYGDDVMDRDGINYAMLSTRLDKSQSNIGSTMSNITKKMKDAKKQGILNENLGAEQNLLNIINDKLNDIENGKSPKEVGIGASLDELKKMNIDLYDDTIERYKNIIRMTNEG